jgi:L-asparaginase
MRDPIQILVAGGTFDKVYDPLKGELYFNATQIGTVLQDCNFLSLQTHILELMLKDSLDMSHEDRLEIAKCCFMASPELIVITHGTDTMLTTAKVIREVLTYDQVKTVVLTGAMFPYTLKRTDASANLASALLLVQVLPPGVYVCMSGSVFPVDNCFKNVDEGCFQPLDETEYEAWLQSLRGDPTTF